MFFSLLIHISTFVSIGYYLIFTIWSISLYFMHDFKLQNLQFKQFIDDIVIDL